MKTVERFLERHLGRDAGFILILVQYIAFLLVYTFLKATRQWLLLIILLYLFTGLSFYTVFSRIIRHEKLIGVIYSFLLVGAALSGYAAIFADYGVLGPDGITKKSSDAFYCRIPNNGLWRPKIKKILD
jgi:hypothetical protein